MPSFRTLCFFGLALFVAAPAAAELKAGSPVFIVNLSDPDNGFTVVSARTFDDAIGTNSAADWPVDRHTQNALEAGRDPNPALQMRAATPLERVIGGCHAQRGGAPVSAEIRPLIERLYDCVSCLNAYREHRFFSQPGDDVVLLVLYDANQFDASSIRPVFREAPRQSELLGTARALAGLLRMESQLAPSPSCEAFVYTLQRSRSRLTVDVPVPAGRRESRGGGGAVDPLIDPPSTGAATASRVLTSPEVVIGPPERWFFSADFSLSGTGVQLGKEPGADAKRVKDKDFFVSLNFALADLLPDRDARLQRRGLLRELLVKVQATPSRRPWEAWAVGLGLRGYRMRTLFWNMDVVHPYFTVGRQTVDDETRWRAVAGLGFDPRSLGGKD